MQRSILVGIVGSALLLLAALLYFVQTKDPMMLVFAGRLIALLWLVILIVHILRHGIPVRIVADERGPR